MGERTVKYDFPSFPSMECELDYLLQYVKYKIEKGEVHRSQLISHSPEKEEVMSSYVEIYEGAYPEKERPCIRISTYNGKLQFSGIIRGQYETPEFFKEIADKVSSIEIYLP